MGICIYKMIHDSFLHPVFPFRKLSSHINANYAYKNRSYYSVWEYVVTKLFLIISFLHLIFLFLSLSSHLNANYAYKNRSFYDVWEYAVTELFMITFFLHPVFPFLRLSSHLSGDALEVDSQSLHYLWDLQLS